jgi:hypothetical protein
MDYAVTYLISATVSALTLGQFGNSKSAAPNFIIQIAQPNGPLVGFALLSGVCMGVGDAAMQYAVALLGLSVAPAIINALIIIVGTISLTFLCVWHHDFTCLRIGAGRVNGILTDKDLSKTTDKLYFRRRQPELCFG